MPGIDTGAPDRTDTSSGRSASPKACPVACSRTASLRIDRLIEPGRPAGCKKARAQRRAKHEGRRHGNAKPVHVDKARALAAEQLT